jgi:uncharacterized protein DUF1186/SEC-C motif-containing protein
MDIRELLAHLDRHRGSFPEHFVAEAVTRREEVIPILLETLEDIDRDPEPWLVDQGRMVHIHALYLLALFRETRAYPLLMRIFSRPGEFAFDLAGDTVTQDLGRILASVSGGDMSGMAALIENEQANEYVRSAAMGGMVSLVVTGQRTRDEVMAYFLTLFHKLERKPGPQWDGLAHACADLWPQEAVGELRRAYEEGLVDTGAINWQDVEHALFLGKQDAMQLGQYRPPLVSDLAQAMGWMQCFHDAKRYDEPETDSGEDQLWLPSSEWTPAPIRRSAPKVGRNEACPCGSGKKFKKCCGGAESGRAVAQPN